MNGNNAPIAAAHSVNITAGKPLAETEQERNGTSPVPHPESPSQLEEKRVPRGSTPKADRSRRKLAMLKRCGLFGQDLQGASIVRACSLDDLRGAYQLVHDSFAENHFIEPEPSRIRLRIYETEPDTATFVAKANGSVVGVLSIVGDSREFGLPSDAAFGYELNTLRAKGARLCEVTNQAVATEYRKSGVATELMRCAMAHTMKSGYDEAVASVSPSHGGFYQLLNFREIGSQRSYSKAINDPVVALSMDVSQYRVDPAGLDEAELFIRHFLVEGNHFQQNVVTWDLEAKRRFLDRELLQRLFISETGYITLCSKTELRAMKQVWGERLFASVTGESLFISARKWIGAILCVLHVHDDHAWLPVPFRSSHH